MHLSSLAIDGADLTPDPDVRTYAATVDNAEFEVSLGLSDETLAEYPGAVAYAMIGDDMDGWQDTLLDPDSDDYYLPWIINLAYAAEGTEGVDPEAGTAVLYIWLFETGDEAADYEDSHEDGFDPADAAYVVNITAPPWK